MELSSYFGTSGSLDSVSKISNNHKEKVQNFVASLLWWKLVPSIFFLTQLCYLLSLCFVEVWNSQYSTLRKIPKVRIISFCVNFVKTQNFPTIELRKIMVFYSVSCSGVCYHRSFTFSVYWDDRSSHQRCSIKKGILRNFTKCTGKHLSQSLSFNKVAGLRSTTLLKKNSGTGIFLWILWNFWEHLLYRTPLDDCL